MELPVKDIKTITTSGAVAPVYFSYSVNWGYLYGSMYKERLLKQGVYQDFFLSGSLFLPFFLSYQTHS